MPKFNKDKYITDDSYEIPWDSLRGNINQEGTVRRYIEVLKPYIDWEDHATVTDVQGPYRSIVVEGIGSQGEEVVFVKYVKFMRPSKRKGDEVSEWIDYQLSSHPRSEERLKPTSSTSYIYIDGKRFSPYKMTEHLKQTPKEMERRDAIQVFNKAIKQGERGPTGLDAFLRGQRSQDIDWS